MAESPRKKAVKIIMDIEKKSAYPNIEMNKLRNSNEYNNTDLKFIGELVNGVLKYRITLDYIISKHSSVKINKIAPYVLNVLRCGIYQIIYMDKVPVSAAVNESVKLIKKSSVARLSSFVNAVLRAVSIDDINTLDLSTSYGISVKYSFPLWLTELWLNDFGHEFTQELMESLNRKPKLTIRRCNKITREALEQKLNSDGVLTQRVSFDGFEDFDYCLTINKINSLNNLKAFVDADFYIQDAAAAFAAYLLNPSSGDVVIDMCAAPGGKSIFLSELMAHKGKIYAFDIYEHKINLINDNCRKYNSNIITAELNDSSIYNPKYFECADKILCDVPCSGFGIISKKPDIRYNRKENEIESLAELSYKILQNAAKYLKPGGSLVFSTCTFEKRENEDVIRRFLDANPCFSPYPYKDDGEYYKTFYPHIDDTDGFFVCRLVKNGVAAK